MSIKLSVSVLLCLCIAGFNICREQKHTIHGDQLSEYNYSLVPLTLRTLNLHYRSSSVCITSIAAYVCQIVVKYMLQPKLAKRAREVGGAYLDGSRNTALGGKEEQHWSLFLVKRPEPSVTSSNWVTPEQSGCCVTLSLDQPFLSHPCPHSLCLYFFLYIYFLIFFPSSAA